MEYVVIESEAYPVNTAAECERAELALQEAGEDSADVWTSPAASIEQLEDEGDLDGYKNGRKIWASEGSGDPPHHWEPDYGAPNAAERAEMADRARRIK